MIKALFVYILTFLSLVSCTDRTSRRISSLSNDQYSDQINEAISNLKDNHHVLNRGELPLAYERYDKVINRLSLAQNKLLKDGQTIKSKLFIVNSQVLDARVVTVKKNAIEATSVISISTKLIEEMYKNGLDKGDNQIIGILAHEMAHPLDDMDETGIYVKGHKTFVSQAREVRADSEALLLLKESGFNVESVYDSLINIFNIVKTDNTKSSSDLLSTHPEDKLRLSIHKMALTKLRYDTGSMAKYTTQDTLANIENEVRIALMNINYSSMPKNILQAHKACDKYLKKSEAKYHPKLNVSLMALNHKLSDMDNISNQDIRKHADFMMTSFISSIMGEPHKIHSVYKGNKDELSRDLREVDVHYLSVEKLDIYQDTVYLKQIIPKIKEVLDNGNILTLRPFINNLHRLIPFRVVESELGQILVRKSKEAGNDLFGHHVSINEVNIDWSEFYFRNIFKNLTTESKLKFLITKNVQYTSGDFNPFLLSYKYPAKATKQDKIRTRNKFLHSLSPNETTKLRNIAKIMWKDKELFSMASLVRYGSSIDWELGFQLLNIEEDEGMNKLSNGMFEFLNSSRFDNFISTLKSMNDFSTPSTDALAHTQKIETRKRWISKKILYKIEELSGGDFYDKAIAPAFYNSIDQDLADEFLGRNLVRSLVKSESYKDGVSIINKTLDKFDGSLTRRRYSTRQEIVAESIDSSIIEKVLKRDILKGYYTNKLIHRVEHPWYLQKNNEASRKILEILTKYKITNSVDFIQNFSSDSYAQTLRSYYIDINSQAIIKTLTSMKLSSQSEVLEKISIVFGENESTLVNVKKSNSLGSQKIKKYILAAYGALFLDIDSKFEMLLALANSGSSQFIDSSLKEIIPTLNIVQLEKLLLSKSINNTSMQVSVLRSVLNFKFKKNGTAVLSDIEKIVNEMNMYVSSRSIERDSLLDEIAWKFSISDMEILDLLEKQKTTNWKSYHPLIVNKLSTISTFFGRLDNSSKHELISYLIDPKDEALPSNLHGELKLILTNEYESTYQQIDSDIIDEKFKSEVEVKLLEVEAYIEEVAFKDDPAQKIMMFELLVSSGDKPLSHEENFPFNLSRRHLAHNIDGPQEKTLTSFLKVIPIHEKSITLAYLLSLHGVKNESSVLKAFEAFDTVGIKAAQFESIFNFTGDKTILEETKLSKSRSKPLSRIEVIRTLEEHFSADELRKLSVKNKVGSASIKAVVEVDINNKSYVVMMQRPYAKEKIEDNLKRSKELISNLRSAGFIDQTALLKPAILALENQLEKELDMRLEARNIKNAQLFSLKYNSKHKSSLSGWTVNVPGISDEFSPKKKIMFLEKANGVEFNDLTSQRIKDHVGSHIVEFSLEQMFTTGHFDIDRHTGNVIIDEENKVIHQIDWGQGEVFKKEASAFKGDDILKISKLLKAFAKKNERVVLDSLLDMSELEKPLGKQARTRLLKMLKTVLNKNKNEKINYLLPTVLNSLEREGVIVEEKISFGLLKGLAVLLGEEYVSPSRFRQIVKKQVRKTYLNKAPFILGSKVTSCLESIKLLFGKI